jgi:hypothetical protein
MARRKKKKVGSIDWTPLIVLGVLGVGAAFAYKALFGSGSGGGGGLIHSVLGPTGTTTNNQATQNAQNAANTAAGGMAPAPALPAPTITTSQAANAANTIFTTALNGASSIDGSVDDGDQDTITNQVLLANNISDLNLIIAAFGTRQVSGNFLDLCGVAGYDCTAVTLGPFLHMALSPANLAQLNDDIANSQINFSF